MASGIAGLSRFARKQKIDDKTTAYVCTDKTCKPPVTGPEAVKSLLN